MTKSRVPKGALLGVLAVSALLLSACASSSAPSTTGGATDAAGSSDVVAAAQVKVDEYTSAEQTFPMPTESFDAGTGTAVVIASGSAAAVVQTNAQIAVDAFTAMGWDVPLDGAFSPPVTGGLIVAAVATAGQSPDQPLATALVES